MKKMFALAATAAAMLSASVPANAALGIASGNAPLIVVGAVLLAANSGMVVRCVAGPHFTICRRGTVVGSVGIVGILLLDGKQGQDMAYSALSAADAAKLGLTDSAKVEAFNHELLEINAIREDILSETLSRANKGEQVQAADLHARWMEAKAQGLISPAAFEVLEAVSKQASDLLK